MNCPTCNVALSPNDNWCGSCGKYIKSQAAAPVAVPPPAAPVAPTAPDSPSSPPISAVPTLAPIGLAPLGGAGAAPVAPPTTSGWAQSTPSDATMGSASHAAAGAPPAGSWSQPVVPPTTGWLTTDSIIQKPRRNDRAVVGGGVSATAVGFIVLRLIVAAVRISSSSHSVNNDVDSSANVQNAIPSNAGSAYSAPATYQAPQPVYSQPVVTQPRTSWPGSSPAFGGAQTPGFGPRPFSPRAPRAFMPQVPRPNIPDAPTYSGTGAGYGQMGIQQSVGRTNGQLVTEPTGRVAGQSTGQSWSSQGGQSSGQSVGLPAGQAGSQNAGQTAEQIAVQGSQQLVNPATGLDQSVPGSTVGGR